jgi:hypothetical protein
LNTTGLGVDYPTLVLPSGIEEIAERY